MLWYVKISDPTLQRNDDSEDSTEVPNQTAEVTTTDNHYCSIDRCLSQEECNTSQLHKIRLDMIKSGSFK